MLCASCGEDREPIIEGDQSGRFMYTCGNAGCHVTLGPVRREGASSPAPPVLPPPASLPGMLAAPGALVNVPALPTSGGAVSVAELSASYAESIRRQIAMLDAELAKADALRKERDMLVRMLAAAERPARRRRPRAEGDAPLIKGSVVSAVPRDRLT